MKLVKWMILEEGVDAISIADNVERSSGRIQR